MHLRRLLVAVDQGPIAAHAALAGLELARSLNAEAALVHAVEPSLGLSATDAGLVGHDIIRQNLEDGQRVMSDFCASSKFAGPHFIPEGPPDREIIEVARRWHADLIVIGSHGRRGFQAALLGSVAEAVVRQAPCSVLVIKAEAASVIGTNSR